MCLGICKPLIVVEGFNAPLIGETDFESFRSKIEERFIAFTGNQLTEEFESAGYGIVYVDFDDGTASLEDNAEVVKTVIHRVNELKAAAGCTQPNTVWGESMGGVLAKLALREMEVTGEYHDCETLITFDSPLRGANIPLGFQAMLYDLANLPVGTPPFGVPLRYYAPELDDAMTTLESPAASQLLLYHLPSYFGPNPRRSQPNIFQ